MLKRFKLVSFLLCLCMMAACFSGFAEKDAITVTAGAQRDQYVRVHLTRIGGFERLDVTLTAPYQLVTEDGHVMYVHADNQLTFQIKENQIYLYYHGLSQKMGDRVLLARTNDSHETKAGFTVTNFPALYMGDLTLSVSEGKLRPVLKMHVEDYLLGVVPYEMGDSFPLEALKAQAIAARTYALRCQGRYDDYDLVDNTNDQAFKGYVSGHNRSEQAVEETRGMCGYYKGELAQCYYSASNGGQTELVQNVWASREPFRYYASVEDPYDVANPESTVRRFGISKEYAETQEAPAQLRQLITPYVAEWVQDPLLEPDDIKILQMFAVKVDAPSLEESKHMTNLHLEMNISLRGYVDQTALITDMSPEEVHLFGDEAAASVAVSTAAPQESAEYVPLRQPVVLDIPIFPVVEQALGLSINSNYQNEIWSIAETAEAFTIEVRRYGHGVGMSQRGAQWMASEHQKTYLDILAFYYPGMDLIRFPEQARLFASSDDALRATAGPAPSPTPRPTVMPLTQKAERGQWFAAVTEISDDSSLNLRAEPSLNSEILLRLYKGQRLLVMERCDDGWVKVKTDVSEGYVKEEYLSEEK